MHLAPAEACEEDICRIDIAKYTRFASTTYGNAMTMPRALAFVVREFEEMIPPTLFFAAGFNLIVLTTQLFLDDYRQQFVGFMVATTTALVVGKAVLLANALPFLRRFDRAPLIQPILFKTAVYFAVVFLLRVLEKIIEYLID